MVCEAECCGFSDELDSCGSTGAFPLALTVRDGSRVMERLLLPVEKGDKGRSPLYSMVLQERCCRSPGGAGPAPLPLPPNSFALMFDVTMSCEADGRRVSAEGSSTCTSPPSDGVAASPLAVAFRELLAVVMVAAAAVGEMLTSGVEVRLREEADSGGSSA